MRSRRTFTRAVPVLVMTMLIIVLVPATRAVTAPIAATETPAVPVDHVVTYEAFGGVGDNGADDLPPIVAAHAFANTHGLPVKSEPDDTVAADARVVEANGDPSQHPQGEGTCWNWDFRNTTR